MIPCIRPLFPRSKQSTVDLPHLQQRELAAPQVYTAEGGIASGAPGPSASSHCAGCGGGGKRVPVTHEGFRGRDQRTVLFRPKRTRETGGCGHAPAAAPLPAAARSFGTAALRRHRLYHPGAARRVPALRLSDHPRVSPRPNTAAQPLRALHSPLARGSAPREAQGCPRPVS